MDKLKSSTGMLKLCCIADLIRFMMNEAEKLMKGSVQEDGFYIVHDDLMLMTSKETINWMKQNGYVPRCLLPLNGLQDGNPYARRPIGNSGDVRQATSSVRHPDLYKKYGPPSFSLVLPASSSDNSCLDEAKLS